MAIFSTTTAVADPASSSSSEAPKSPTYSLTLSAGEGYAFEEDAAFPTFDPATIERSVTVKRSVGKWLTALSYSDSEKKGQGFEVKAGYDGKDEKCFDHHTYGCTFTLSVLDLQDQQTGTLNAGLSLPLRAGTEKFTPFVSLTGATIAGDRSESSFGVGLTLPYKYGPFTFQAKFAEVYAFEAEVARPNWGAEIIYELRPGLEFAVGYKSKQVLNAETDRLEVDRVATASLKMPF